MPNDAAARPHRTERLLGVVAATVIGLGVLAIIAILIGGASGADAGTGVWPVVFTLPLIALPLGILLILAFVILSAVRRSREARGGG